ncbi:hypothetical protein IFR04_002748 [Cadophora malorum]|uniref:Uncharacterized protein n=1 Tax=Cadophora malorum TaxID=108018 RepID=A0A8H7WFW3_9HELO|nr:hypothetical protein IFR04_002748 [Cadophora malorum]
MIAEQREIITPVLISADVTVFITLGTDQSDLTTFPVSILQTSVHITGTLGAIYSGIRRHSTLSQGESSNSSTPGPETSLDCSGAAQVDVSSQTSNIFELNLQVTNGTISADDSDEEPPPRRSKPRAHCR